MQQNINSTPSLDLAATSPAKAAAIKTGPIELDLSVLKHVSGGSPKGTWESLSSVIESPKGTW